MSRHHDWQPRLIAYLAGAHKKPFQAGEHDCATFTAGAIEAMTGVRHGDGLAGKYKTIKAGVRALKKAGYVDHVAVVASLFTEVRPALAMPGDVGVVKGAFGFGALGIVQGEGVYVLTETGMAIVSRLELQKAFRV